MDTVMRAMRQALGFSVVAYRYALITTDEQGGRQEGIFVLDIQEQVADPPERSRWVDRNDLAGLPLKRPDHLATIDECLRELETGTAPAFRQPWEERGWFKLAASWIEETLRSLGRHVTAAPEQVRWWSLSRVLRVATDGGDVYFKASAKQPLFAAEPALLSYLASHNPGRVPAPIATEPHRGWMLLDDIGPRLDRNLSVERTAASSHPPHRTAVGGWAGSLEARRRRNRRTPPASSEDH
ncbi:MAG: hypothetical protein ACRDJW_18680 [Thermomicrobiales bacterium]